MIKRTIFPGFASHWDTIALAFHMPPLDLHHCAVPDKKAKLTFPVETPSSILGRLNINSQDWIWTVYQG